MKTIACTVVIFLSSALTCHGQQITTEKNAQDVLALIQALELESELASSFATVLKEHGQKAEGYLNTYKNDTPTLRRKMKALHHAQDERVKAMLTAPQYLIYMAEMKEVRNERRREYIRQQRESRSQSTGSSR